MNKVDLTEKEQIDVIKSLTTGWFSKEATMDEMDEIFRDNNLEHLISESNTFKTQHVQALLKIIEILNNRK